MGAQYGTGSRTCQPVNNHGIRPATMPGATTKKAALPIVAVGLRMATPLSVHTAGFGVTAATVVLLVHLQPRTPQAVSGLSFRPSREPARGRRR